MVWKYIAWLGLLGRTGQGLVWLANVIVPAGWAAAVSESLQYVLAGPLLLQIVVAVSCIVLIIVPVAGGLTVFLLMPVRQYGYMPRWRKWYDLPGRTLRWDFTGYLSCPGEYGGELQVYAFQARLLVARGEGIAPKRFYIECKRTATKHDVLLDPHDTGSRDDHVRAEDFEFLPSGKRYYCIALFDKAGDHHKDSGMTKAAFLSRYDGMTFVFDYDNTQFKARFSRGELETIIDMNYAALNQPPIPTARIRSSNG